jgi:hypothetical protein
MQETSNVPKNREKLLLLIAGEWIARAIYVATKLQIADHLGEGSKSIQDLAALSRSHEEFLLRLLRTLAGAGVFKEERNGIFANNEVSCLLSRSNPDNLHATSLYYGEDVHPAWDELFNSLITGKPGFDLAFNQPVFSYYKENPERGIIFQDAMKSKSRAVTKSALSSYNFGQYHSICDVGGGNGHFLGTLLDHYPHLQGMVFDLPEVIHELKKSSLPHSEERFKLIEGDFFASIPEGADAYLLKSILHDWNDRQAEQILQNCHSAMRSDSRLLIVEIILLPKDQSIYAKCMDLLMLALCEGKERSLNSFEQLFERSGFKLEKIYPTATEFSMLEVVKK